MWQGGTAMARIVGVFAGQDGLDDVVEQLELNGISQIRLVGPDELSDDTPQHLSMLGIPSDQVGAYDQRLRDQRWLMIIESSAIDLPLVQRALRSGDAFAIDILPEAG
jgi:hypothetical protein